jgi:hypothetical protein
VHATVQALLTESHSVAAHANRPELTVDELARGFLVAIGDVPRPRSLRGKRRVLPVSEDARRLIAELSELDDEQEIALRLLEHPAAKRALAADGHDVELLRRHFRDR